MKLVICEKPASGRRLPPPWALRAERRIYRGKRLPHFLVYRAFGTAFRSCRLWGAVQKWSYDSLPILPQEWQYTVAADKGKQFKILKDLMHRADVSEVVNACDAGREGELIFRFVYEVAGCKKPFTRLWISSMENGRNQQRL